MTPEEPLTSVNEKLWFRDIGQLPVVESAGTRGDSSASSRSGTCSAPSTARSCKRNRLLARVRTVGETGGEVDYLELPEKHRLIEVDVPACDRGPHDRRRPRLRSRYGVSVLAVKRLTREGIERRFVPEPADRFEHGDVLVVLGSDDAIARLREGAPLPQLTAGP